MDIFQLLDQSPNLNQLPYEMAQEEKERGFIPAMSALTEHHYQCCPEYTNIIDLLYSHQTNYPTTQAIPYLPVNLFKEICLKSIPQSEVYKTLLSSGTTNAVPSQIILDKATASRQGRALASIMQSFIGNKRVPMLIIDTEATIKDPKRFSARGAAIVGMSQFGRDHFFALDDDMQLKSEPLNNWLKGHRGSELFIFGFTYILWQYFYQAIAPQEYDLSKAILFHSGGWKKLIENSVDNSTFKAGLLNNFNITRCHNFYGMVEQLGSVFVECEEGVLHCPSFADIIIRDPITWDPLPEQKIGIVQLVSLLPTSYPGHSLLSEDLGIIKGIDTCPCGRKGKFFSIQGRVPESELRGCGDTFAMSKKVG